MKSPERETCVTISPREKLLVFFDHVRSNEVHRKYTLYSFSRRPQGSATTVINHVALVIASRQAEFVKLHDPEEEKEIAAAFYNLASDRNKFPGIRLLIDGTHVPIEKPSFSATGGRPKSYINRKGFASFNVMVMTDHLGRIRFFDSSSPGSNHDATVLRTSPLPQYLERTFDPLRPRFVLGDMGYPCSREILTPVRDDRVNDAQTQAYNRAHKSNRVKVEHAIGMLKKRFPVLMVPMRYNKLDNVQRKIAACIVLNNIGINSKDNPPDSPSTDDERAMQQTIQWHQIDLPDDDTPAHFHQRNRLIENFFSRRV